jgi:hypothetical protein
VVRVVRVHRASEEILVEAISHALDAESATSGTVLTREFLERVPAGRSYQQAVQLVSGVSGIGGQAVPGAGVRNEATYLLDGVSISDPVTGTFSLSLPLGAVEQVDILTSGQMPEHPGAVGPVVALSGATGTNNLRAEVGVHHLVRLQGPGTADTVTAGVSGPIVRDRVWLHASAESAGSTHPTSDAVSRVGMVALTAQPTPGHRLTLRALGDAVETVDVDGGLRPAGGGVTGRWQWFVSPTTNVDSRASVQGRAVAGDAWERQVAASTVSLVGVDDPLGGTHDLKAGAAAERTGWRLGGEWAQAWLGVPVPAVSETAVGSMFAQDSWRLGSVVWAGGVRVDGTLGRPWASPRLSIGWDPSGRGRSRLLLGAARSWGHLGLATLAIAPEQGLSRLDSAFAAAEWELIEDVAVIGRATLRDRSGLPTVGGGRVDQTSWSTELRLTKIDSRRWFGELAWTHTGLLVPSDRTLVDDGSLIGFSDAIIGSASWALPTDPWTQTLDVLASAHLGPLGTVVSDPTAGVRSTARWTAGARFTQDIDLRRGKLHIDLEARHVVLLDDPVAPTRLLRLQGAVPDTVAWQGPRIEAGLRYGF